MANEEPGGEPFSFLGWQERRLGFNLPLLYLDTTRPLAWIPRPESVGLSLLFPDKPASVCPFFTY